MGFELGFKYRDHSIALGLKSVKTIQITLPSLFGCLISIATLVLLWEFIPALLWGGVIAVVIWPIHSQLQMRLRRPTLAASISVLVVAFLISIPIFSLFKLIISDGQGLLKWIINANQHGLPLPDNLSVYPFSHKVELLWKKYLIEPGFLSNQIDTIKTQLQSVRGVMGAITRSVLNWFVVLFFSLLTLFFFLKNGRQIIRQIEVMGKHYLPAHWHSFWLPLKSTLVGAINGTIILSLLFGLIMGVIYSLIGLPAAALVGCLTAVFALIPFGAPALIVVMAGVAWAQVGLLSAIVLLVIGFILNFVMDHIAKPLFIGSSTQLPFLAVLLSVLGGVNLMGLLGLFVGPAIMVAFLSVWRQVSGVRP